MAGELIEVRCYCMTCTLQFVYSEKAVLGEYLRANYLAGHPCLLTTNLSLSIRVSSYIQDEGSRLRMVFISPTFLTHIALSCLDIELKEWRGEVGK